MALKPDSWLAVSGAWGTDIVQETDHAGGHIYSGPFSIRFNATTPASDPVATSPLITVPRSGVYCCAVRSKVDGVAAGNNVTIRAETLADDRSTSPTGIDVFPLGLYPNTGWQHDSVYLNLRTATFGTTRFVRFRVTKANVAFQLWIDRVNVYRVGQHFHAYNSIVQNVAAATTAKVVYDTEEFNRTDFDGSNGFNLASDDFTATEDGVHEFSGRVGVDTGVTSANVSLSIFKNAALYKEGTVDSTTLATGLIVNTGPIDLVAGDTIDMRVTNTDGANARDTLAGQASTYFTGKQLHGWDS